MGVGVLAIITLFALSLFAMIWLLKRRLRALSFRLNRPIFLAMHDSSSGLDQLLHPHGPRRVPAFPGIAWTDTALELWATSGDTQPIATIPTSTILVTSISRMPALIPRPAIKLQINGLTRPVFLVLYGPSLLDLLPMGKARLRATARQPGLSHDVEADKSSN
ncbi:hypothetical protein [Herbiconiux sp. UC225_62]|uniref:hypothetical protein n=1 Tax=Herbiconiux sp. UC225_62 TaxID=3350168 RepID=UPI0036D3B4C8